MLYVSRTSFRNKELSLNNFFLSKGMALGRRQESEIWREEIWRGKLVSDTPTL